MAGVGRRGLWLHVTVAFRLVLSAWVSSSTCLSLHGLGKNLQHTGVDEATVAGERRGKILFDGKDLELQAEPSSAAVSGKLLKIILGQSTLSGKLPYFFFMQMKLGNMHQIDFAFILKRIWRKRFPQMKKQHGSI